MLQNKITKVISINASGKGWGANNARKLDKRGTEMAHKLFRIRGSHSDSKHFMPELENQQVLVSSDNVWVVHFIERQGDAKSPRMFQGLDTLANGDPQQNSVDRSTSDMQSQ